MVDSVWVSHFKRGLNHHYILKYQYKVRDENECKKDKGSLLW